MIDAWLFILPSQPVFISGDCWKLQAQKADALLLDLGLGDQGPTFPDMLGTGDNGTALVVTNYTVRVTPGIHAYCLLEANTAVPVALHPQHRHTCACVCCSNSNPAPARTLCMGTSLSM